MTLFFKTILNFLYEFFYFNALLMFVFKKKNKARFGYNCSSTANSSEIQQSLLGNRVFIWLCFVIFRQSKVRVKYKLLDLAIILWIQLILVKFSKVSQKIMVIFLAIFCYIRNQLILVKSSKVSQKITAIFLDIFY